MDKSIVSPFFDSRCTLKVTRKPLRASIIIHITYYKPDATILRVGYKHYCERSEQKFFFGCTLHIMPFWGYNSYKERHTESYRTALLQYLTGHARAFSLGL